MRLVKSTRAPAGLAPAAILCLILGALAGHALLGGPTLTQGGRERGSTEAMSNAQQAPIVYVGTYTQGTPQTGERAQGIYIYRLEPRTGALTPLGSASGVINPSFLALDARHRYLYAVNEVGEFAGLAGGGLSGFAVDPQSGALTPLNQQPTHGAAPCYVTVDRTGRWALVANYGSGSVTVLPIEEGGRLGEATAVVQHRGAGANPERQEGPHAHCAILDPGNRHVLVADLGLDRIFVYRLDPARGTLPPHDTPWVAVAPGSGPRHLEFHPNGRYLYATNELASTVTAFAYDAAQGTLRELETLSLLPPGWAGANTAADLHVAPSGRFLYASNRGHDSIAIHAIDEKAGTLRALGHVSTQGRTPRNFAIDPTGAFLLAANQESGTIVTFRIDPEAGTLTPTGHVARVPAPVCVRIVTREKPW